MAAVMQKQPVPANLAQYGVVQKIKYNSLDVSLLHKKLEAARRDQEAVEKRKLKPKRMSVAGIRIPRIAAQQFAATTTPMQHDARKAVKKVQAAKTPKESSKLRNPEIDGALIQRQRTVEHDAADGAQWREDEKPCANPKKMFAALSIGMSEIEAVDSRLNPLASKEDSVLNSSKASPEPNIQVTLETRVKDGLDSKHKRQRSQTQMPQPNSTAIPQRSASARGYKPGDAAKRNSINRRTEIADPFDRQYRDSIDSISEVGTDGEDATNVQRPRLRHDRPNWAQESQCGDSARHFLTVPLAHRNKASTNRPTLPSGPGAQAAERNDGTATKQRRNTDERLIKDAVQLIREEKKSRRKQSVVGFLKKVLD